MAAKKILFFTAGPVPTGPELADIAAINALTDAFYEVGVRNRLASPNYGTAGVGGGESADFVAGTLPTGYGATGGSYENTPVFSIPDPAPEAGEVGLVYNGQEIEVEGGTVTITVEDGAVTAAFEAEA